MPPPVQGYPQYAAPNGGYVPINNFAPQAPVISQMPADPSYPTMNNNLAPLEKDVYTPETKNINTKENMLPETKQEALPDINTKNVQTPQTKTNAINIPSDSDTQNMPATALDKNGNDKKSKQAAPMKNEPLDLGVVDGPANLSKTPVTDALQLNEKTQRIKLPQNKAPQQSAAGKWSAGMQVGAMGISAALLIGCLGKFIKKIKH